MHILQDPTKPFTTFSAGDTLKTMKVEQEPQSEPNAEASEEINAEIVRKELMNVNDVADNADEGVDDYGAMDAEDGGGVDLFQDSRGGVDYWPG